MHIVFETAIEKRMHTAVVVSLSSTILGGCNWTKEPIMDDSTVAASWETL